ncbi:MAG: hypothetical protein ACE5GS_06830 [Kiloniellaceae bacterium]
MRLFPICAAALALAACTAAQQAAVQGGVEKIKDANDAVALTLIQAACGMTVGAYHRLENPVQKRGVDLLCGGDGQDPLTAGDVERLMRAAETLRRGRQK